MPDADKIVLLVRTTLLTLNDALQTGNYSVLRERGSPNFQAAATAAQLAEAFAKLRAMQLDLFGVAMSVPQLVVAPSIDAQNRLRISGIYPGQGLQLNFDLQYEPVAGQWRLFAIAVNPVTVAVASQPATPQPAQTADPAKNTTKKK